MLLFDFTSLQGFGETKRHGGGKYAEIIFDTLCSSNVSMCGIFHSDGWMPEEITEKCGSFHIKMFDVKHESVNEILKRSKAACVFSALPNDEILSIKSVPVLVTIHGLRRI